METSEELNAINKKIKDWCYEKRTQNERANPQWPLFNCMDQAIITLISEMELRISTLENKLSQLNNNECAY